MSPPVPCAIITRAASRETRNDPRASTSCSTSQSAADVFTSGFEIDSPALLTTRSTPPNASVAAANAAATSASLVTSAVTGTATSAGPRLAATQGPEPGPPSAHPAQAPRGCGPLPRRRPDAQAAAGHQRDPPRQRPGRRPPPQL